LNQDLVDWLKTEKISGGTGLLLAPIDSDNQKINETGIEDFITHLENKIEIENENPENLESENNNEPELKNEFNPGESENIFETEPEQKKESELELELENEAKINLEINSEESQEIKAPEEISEENNENQKSETLEEFSNKISELNQSLQEIQEIFDANANDKLEEPEEKEIEQEQKQQEDINENENDKEWQQRATGFELSLDEPPPELWTHINPEDYESENNEDDDDELEYEQGMSLQGAAYVPKAPKGAPGRGQNFTERLQQSLRGRKQRAEKLREEEEKKPKHSYISKVVIICATLLMLLGLAYLALYFIQQWTPEKIYERADSKLKNGDYEGAMNLFYRGYKHYPNELKFLTGAARAAESADRVQTAVNAWESYINSLPKDDKENRNLAQLELKRLKVEPEPKKIPIAPKPESKPEKILETPQAPIETEEKTPEPAPKPKPEIKRTRKTVKKKKPEVKEIKKENNKDDKKEEKEVKEENKKQEIKIKLPAAFYEFLNEANEAYNSKRYNEAIIYFHRAIELNGSDVRAYIGLAQAYQAKGMFFDAKRILDDAKRRFKKNLTVETQLEILEGK